MDAHTWAFIGVLVLVGALAGAYLYLLDRIRGVDKRVDTVVLYADSLSKRITEVIDASRGAANSVVGKMKTELGEEARKQALYVVEDRKQELDEQERAIHEEMGNLTRTIFQATGTMQSFINLLRAPRLNVDLSEAEAFYDSEAGRGGHSPGIGSASWEPGDEDDLPYAPGEDWY